MKMKKSLSITAILALIISLLYVPSTYASQQNDNLDGEVFYVNGESFTVEESTNSDGSNVTKFIYENGDVDTIISKKTEDNQREAIINTADGEEYNLFRDDEANVYLDGKFLQKGLSTTENNGDLLQKELSSENVTSNSWKYLREYNASSRINSVVVSVVAATIAFALNVPAGWSYVVGLATNAIGLALPVVYYHVIENYRVSGYGMDVRMHIFSYKHSDHRGFLGSGVHQTYRHE